MEYSAIMLAGGKGIRMGKDIPKQYLLLCGKPIIMHSLERLDYLKGICEIIIVCEQEYQKIISAMCEQYDIKTRIIFAKSGTTRQESVFNGLNVVSHENVIIHEAARPFAILDDFERVLNCPEKNVSLGYQIPFTVVEGHKNIERILQRDNLVNIQLPQKFSKESLLVAHRKAQELNMKYTEDAGMVYELAEQNVQIVQGSSINIKISEPIDLLLGELIYKEYIVKRK